MTKYKAVVLIEDQEIDVEGELYDEPKVEYFRTEEGIWCSDFISDPVFINIVPLVKGADKALSKAYFDALPHY